MDAIQSNSIVSKFLKRLSAFPVFFLIIYVIFLIFVCVKWSFVQSFFMYFDGHSPLLIELQNLIISMLTNPTIQSVIAIIVVGIGFFYLVQKIKDEGHVFYENDGIEAKYFKSLSVINQNISYILLPFLIFLLFRQNLLELGVLVGIIIFNHFVGLNCLDNWVRITRNYDDLVNFKSSNNLGKISIRFRDAIASGVIFAMIFTTILFLFVINFNLISIIYIEICLFMEYFILCSVTYNIEGPLNIFLVGSNTIFNRAYIFENSESKGQMFIILKNNETKKIMKSSILYIEPSDPDNP